MRSKCFSGANETCSHLEMDFLYVQITPIRRHGRVHKRSAPPLRSTGLFNVWLTLFKLHISREEALSIWVIDAERHFI